MITRNEILENEVRAMSWKQPYADLMLRGKQETRKWSTNYRGLVLICACKKSYSQAEIMEISGQAQSDSIDRVYDFLHATGKGEPYKVNGSAIGIGRLINCREMKPEDQNSTFVRYKAGLYVFEFTDVTPIIPFTWVGNLGWRKLTEPQKAVIVLDKK